MDDQLDKDLSKRIKEVFDNYEDTSADAGWLELRKKFPEEKERRGLAWLWLAAALLLLFLGAGTVWIFMKKQPVANHVARHIPTQKQQPVSSQQPGDSATKNRTLAASPTVKSPPAGNLQQASVAPGMLKNETIHKVQQTAIAANKNKGNIILATNAAAPKNGNVQSAANNQTKLAVVQNKSTVEPAINGGNNSQGALPVPGTKPVTNGFTAAVTSKPAAADTSNTKQVAQVKKPVKTIEDMFAADQGNDNKIKIKGDRKVTFGVYASTYFNYARSGNNQVNAGAGLTAAIPLTKNLKLVTGVSINQNSFDYNNSGGVFAAAEPASLAAIYGNQSFSNVGNNTPYSQSASLLGLDVPFNLQYQFNTRKNQLYVLGGFSSGTFINESYNYLYANGNSSSLQPYKGVNDFYFARTLNVAFGVGYPLGKNQIVIEPFFKYPLEGLGAEQLHFGASGVNLKFNFSTKK